MKDIFADLYNRVLSFFNKADEKTENAKDVACNRLKLVLMQDRTNLTPAIMDRMRTELIELLSKYMELDRELLDLNFEHEDEQMALMLSIPVIRAKNEDEINEILAKEDEERKKLKELLGEADDEMDDDDDEDESEVDEVEEVVDGEKSKKERKKEKFFKKKKGSEKKSEAVSEAKEEVVEAVQETADAETESESEDEDEADMADAVEDEAQNDETSTEEE